MEANARVRLDSDGANDNGDPHLPPALIYSHRVTAKREMHD